MIDSNSDSDSDSKENKCYLLTHSHCDWHYQEVLNKKQLGMKVSNYHIYTTVYPTKWE